MFLGYCCCKKKCSDCESCCTDALPNSLDITFGTGWHEPTIDSGKSGCDDPYSDSCASYFDGQTFNLTFQPWTAGTDYCLNNPVGAGSVDCWYGFVDMDFCPVTTGGCAYPSVGRMSLYAFFECQENGLCRIKVVLNLCVWCLGDPPGVAELMLGRSSFYWQTPEFAFGGEVCSGLSKTAEWTSMANIGNADPEGICAWNDSYLFRNLLVEDGG